MFPHLIVVNSLMSIKTWLCRLLSLKVQTLLQLISLLLLLPLWFLLSFLIVVLLLQLLSTNPVVNQFEHIRLLFVSHLFCANPVAAQLRHRWRATLPRPKATLRSSSRRGFLIEMLPHLIVLNILMSIQTWLCLLFSLKVQTML